MPIILYSFYVMLSHISFFVELGFDIPIFGDRIGFGFWIMFIVSAAYFFIDEKVAFAVGLWLWPCMVLGNATWIA